MTPLTEFFLVVLYFLVHGAILFGKALARKWVFLLVLCAAGLGVYWSPLNGAELIGYGVLIAPVCFFCIGLCHELLSRQTRRRD